MLSVFEKIDQIKKSILFPYGQDKKFDEECDESFERFFNIFYNSLIVLFCIFGSGCVYFFINYELLK